MPGIAIDIGSAWHGGPESWERLMEFEPHTIYGFDPQEPHSRKFDFQGAQVILERKAAWTRDGFINFTGVSYGAHVTEEPEGKSVPCFDLADFIESLNDRICVLKMDAEGAEYPLLEHLIARSVTNRIDNVWVEFHGDDVKRQKAIKRKIKAKWHEWSL